MSGTRVLVVDDSTESLDLISSLLESSGIQEIVAAPDIGRGVAELREHPRDESSGPCDAVLLDLVMPDVDGIESCRRLKRLPDFAHVPVLMVTAVEDKRRLADAFAAGAMDYITKPVNRGELAARVRSATRLKEEADRRRNRERELLALQEELRKANAQLRELAETDPLTRLLNRRAFEQRLDREWRSASRTGLTTSILVCDVDFFKNYNDTYGHPAGDLCLHRIAEVLKAAAHRAGDFAARIGGEEFAVVLPATTMRQAEVVVERIRRGVAGLGIPHRASEVADEVTLSMGLASMTADQGSGWDRLVRAADSALYAAKRGGRNRCVTEERPADAAGIAEEGRS